MKQLRNIAHEFDVNLGDVGCTIRKGSKWFDVSLGDTFELRVCPAAHDGECNSLCQDVGIGKKIGAWKGELISLPSALLGIEHNKKARDREVLRQMLEVGYGKIDNQDIVTALIYVRTK